MSEDSSVEDYDQSIAESIHSDDLAKYEDVHKDLRQQVLPQSDSDMYDDDNEDDDVQNNIDNEREQLTGTTSWGKSKKNYYNKDSESEHSSDEANELDEVKRLQAIRARKLQKQQQKSESEDDQQDGEKLDDDKSDNQLSESSSDNENAGFGDKLFGAKITVSKDLNLEQAKQVKLMEISELLKDMRSVAAKLKYDIDMSKVAQIEGQELSITNRTINFIKQFGCRGDKKMIKRNQRVIDFLKVKEKLVTNYCMYLNYYILGQTKLVRDPSKSINLQENEIMKKLTYYRTLISSIEPIDEEVSYQILIIYRFPKSWQV
jgi:hypothetical protein